MADVRAFTYFGCNPVAAVTSLTFQNSTAMSGATHQPAATVRAQIMSLVAENSIAAMKTGMLPTSDIVHEVVQLIHETNLPAPVIDPVMRSTSGYELITAGAWDLLLSDLMPLARLITPNIPEAEHMTGLRISDEDGMRRAANQIRELGARAVLIKGGHLNRSLTVSEGAAHAIDVLDDEGEVTVFRGDWIEGPPLRGTGCLLSAAITACLANGMSLKESVGAAKHYVAEARSAPQGAKG
ncbi:MAG: hydroxymethylpyrimidine/phosphomethylpyrimidine kinase [Blastocatellia bacterium]|nr:hydroxymethylpyrimidine/phosphomethylpyrimidine kinase [Blastocatellia bacterium]